MTKLDRHERHFRRLAATMFLGTIATFVVASSLAQHAPLVMVVAVFAALVLVTENAGLLLPTSVAVSPQALLVGAAITALHGHGVVPGTMVVAVVGAAYLPTLRARRWRVVAFNAGQLALTAAAAAGVSVALVQHGAPIAVRFPAVALANTAVNVVLCLLGGKVRGGSSLRALWRDMRQAALSDVFFGIVGLVFGRLFVTYGAITLVVAVGAVAIAQLVLRAVVRLRQAYTRLELLYRFTEHLQRSREEKDTAETVVTEMRRAMHAGTAELTILDSGGWRRVALRDRTRRTVTADGRGAPGEVAALGDGPLRVAEVGDAELRANLTARLGSDAVVAPMRSGGSLVGLLAVGDAISGKGFDDEDVRLLEALTNHATVSLDNSQLLGRLRYDSSHDPLTGLPNRARFTELLAELPRPSAILLIDLDRFKEVNDTLGHKHGDLLLQRVARRLSDEIGHRGLVARLGGDEFAIMLPRTTSSNAAQTAVSLLAALEQPFPVGELELEVTGSIGVAIATEPDDDTLRLLQLADVAMYSAKESHSGWELYTPERDHYSPRRLALAGELRRAIASGEMEVHYQPKAELGTGTVCGLEALVRWRHPRYGMLGPDNFIPVAEAAGLIRPLTLLVLTQAIGEQRRLRDLGFDLGVAVNLSVRSVLDVNLPDQIAQVLDACGVPAAALTLEITESSVMADPARTIGVLGRLSGLGAEISVDDFGTGYSSLAYLKRLPADEVKIDRSFIAGMLTSDSDAAIVRSTVDLAHNLGLRAVAEGVEDSTTWDALVALGCDLAQGYYVSAPLPPAALVAWLDANRAAHDRRA